MPTTGKTAAELQDLIMSQLQGRPECKDITGVVVANDSSGKWRVVGTVRNGAKAIPDAAVDGVAAHLRQQYHLVGS